MMTTYTFNRVTDIVLAALAIVFVLFTLASVVNP